MTERRLTDGLSPEKTALLAHWLGGAAQPATKAIADRHSDQPAPLSLGQERLWLLEQLEPGTPASNLFFCGKVAGRLDPAILNLALADLASRHSTLRTVFTTDPDGKTHQHRVDRVPKLTCVDLRSCEASECEEQVRQHMADSIRQPFVMTDELLSHFSLYQGSHYDYLGIVVHHLIGDGSSLDIALRDLSEYYQAHLEGRSPRLEPLPIQFADFARWQREETRESAWGDDLAYWTDELAGASTLNLPTDHTRPSFLGTSADWCELSLDSERSAKVRQFAKDRSTTPFAVLLGVFAATLARSADQRDVTIGTALANRTMTETFELLGNFINIVPLRTTFSVDASFADLVHQAHQKVTKAFSHSGTPFERVVAEINPPRDTSRNAIYQAMFVMQPPTKTTSFAGYQLSLLELGAPSVRTDLELHLWDRTEFVGRLAFNTELFDRRTAEQLAERLTFNIGSMIDKADTPLRHLPWVDQQTAQALLTRGSSVQSAHPFKSAVSRVFDFATHNPGSPALRTTEGKSMTYRELVDAVGSTSAALQSRGISHGSLVGISLPAGLDMVVAVLSVQACGAAYVPLDPDYPRGRLLHIVEDAEPKMVLTNQEGADRLSTGSVPVVDFSSLPRQRAVPPVEVAPHDLAYVIYTSGSTGRPKGVEIEHRALSNLIDSLRDCPGIHPSDRITLIASLSFDASVAELFGGLGNGATVVVVSRDQARAGDQLIGVIDETEVTIVQAVPSTWRLVEAAGGLTRSSVRVWCGGEAVDANLACELSRKHPAAWNLYGPTEATVWTCIGPLWRNNRVGLGPSLAGMDVLILDDELRPVPQSIPGELYLRGVGLARGYHNAPALTAAAFLPDPYGSPGGRLYRTGDVARWTHDGRLEFAGRADHQIKLRGYRIELGDIESALTSLPAVRQAAVANRDQRLIAWVVLDDLIPAGPDQASRLRAELRTKLPDYMVPHQFAFLGELPVSPNGKLDRSALPDLAGSGMLSAPSREPATATERQVVQLAAEVLGTENVGADDDFFAIGGHSMTAAQLVARICLTFEVEISVQDLFSHPTMSHLAGVVDAELQRGRHLTDKDERIRLMVGEMSEDAVDALTAQLLSQQQD